MEDFGPFYRAILTRPDDDTPSLVFADYLEESGHFQRAEYVRLEIARARRSAETVAARADVELERSRELWAGLKHKLEDREKSLPDLSGVTWGVPERGLTRSIAVRNGDVLLRHTQRILASAPINRIRLGQLDRESARLLAKSPWPQFVTSLDCLNAQMGPNALQNLLIGAPWKQLTSFSAFSCKLTDEGVQDLARARTLPLLAHLGLHFNGVTSRGAESIATSSYFDNLVYLNLSCNPIQDAGLQSFASSHRPPRLAYLNLYGSHLTEKCVQLLVGTREFQALRGINLRGNGLTEADLEVVRKRFPDPVV